MLTCAIAGARGYVGAELIRLLDGHPRLQLVAASSRSLHGSRVADVVEGFSDPELCYREQSLQALAQSTPDVLFLALPDGLAARHSALWAELSAHTRVIDLSADHRFDPDWVYGQPETNGAALPGARRIANPGCYATGAQLALWPLRERLIGAPAVFGVSGHSGAGTHPCERNDPARLRNNLLAYKLSGHTHEREVSHRLQHPVRFMPHVAPHFRGIHLTVAAQLDGPIEAPALAALYAEHYANCPMVQVQQAAAEIRQVAGRQHAVIGGFTVSAARPGECVITASLDNLLKGAASQALHNLNMAMHSADELEGLTREQ